MTSWGRNFVSYSKGFAYIGGGMGTIVVNIDRFMGIEDCHNQWCPVEVEWKWRFGFVFQDVSANACRASLSRVLFQSKVYLWSAWHCSFCLFVFLLCLSKCHILNIFSRASLGCLVWVIWSSVAFESHQRSGICLQNLLGCSRSSITKKISNLGPFWGHLSVYTK